MIEEGSKRTPSLFQPRMPRLLSAEEAAAYLGLGGPHALRVHVNVQPIRIGRHWRYDVRLLDAWADRQSGLLCGPVPEASNDNDEAFAASVLGGS